MRISEKEVFHIIKSFEDIFFQGKIYLFGSRLDDEKKGGDIDLYLCPKDKSELEKKEISFLKKLTSLIPDKDIDIVFEKNEKNPVEIEAKNGILLNYTNFKIISYLKESSRHYEILLEAKKQIHHMFPLSKKQYENFKLEDIKNIDWFLYRFFKLQDTVGAKIFKLVASTFHQNVDELSFAKVLSILEKAKIIPSSDDWQALRNARNKIAHEYNDQTDLNIENLNRLYESFAILNEVFKNLQKKYNKNKTN